jgi:hypothetical protein
MVMDFHFRKITIFHCFYFCFESADQAPSNEDVLCKVLTALGALRSEFPSRKTGFTAEPKTFEYFALISFSSWFSGLQEMGIV